MTDDKQNEQKKLPFDFPLTKEDFLHADWQKIIATCIPRIARNYAQLFFAQSNEMALAKEKAQEAVYGLLGAICSPYMHLDDPTQPFRPMAIFSDGSRSPSLEDITDNQLVVLAEIFSTVTDPELQARIADVLWIRKCKHIHKPNEWIRFACQAYLESAKTLEDPRQYVECLYRLERALQLTAYNRNDRESFNQLITYIEDLLAKYSDEEQKFFFYELMQLLLKWKQGDPAKYAPLSEKIARQAEGQHDWHLAAAYWRTKAQWCQLVGDNNTAQQALECEAETFVQDAMASIQPPNPSYIRACSLLYQAITAYEQLAGTGEKRKQMKATLQEWQQKSVGEMKRIGAEIDTTDIVESVRNQVGGKSFEEALWNLVWVTASPKWDSVRQFVEHSSVQFPLTYLMPTSIITGPGRWTAHIAPLDKNASQKVFEDHMFRAAQQFQLINVLCFIDPARTQILQEHFIRIEDFFPLLLHNPFVPEARIRLYARGLYAGFTGDFLVATHLLVPQLENSLRHILEAHGEIVTSLDNKGVQNENSINTLFENHQKRLEQLLGRDIVYDLRGLLAEHTGTNLRNRLAHGLLDDSVFMDSIPYHAIYLWWLTLRLVLLICLSSQPRSDSDPSGQPSESSK